MIHRFMIVCWVFYGICASAALLGYFGYQYYSSTVKN